MNAAELVRTKRDRIVDQVREHLMEMRARPGGKPRSLYLAKDGRVMQPARAAGLSAEVRITMIGVYNYRAELVDMIEDAMAAADELGIP